MLFLRMASALLAVKTPVAACAHINKARAETPEAVMNHKMPLGPPSGIVRS